MRDSSIDLQLRAALHTSDWDRLAVLCKRTLRKHPSHLLSHRYLGHALKMQGHVGASLLAYQKAIQRHPSDAEILLNYGNLLLEQARPVEALPVLEKICVLRPTDSRCWSRVAQACYPIGLHEKGFGYAMVAYNLAQSATEKVAALTQRAIHRRELGQIREAVEDCEAAIAINPADPSNHNNRILFMLGDPDSSPQQITRAAKEYAAVFEPPHQPHWPDYSERAGDPWRKLRVGFISPDFRVHAVMCFAEGILAQLDRRQFEVYAFHLFPGEDHVTARVKCHADHFIRMAGMDHDAQAECIRSHQIDILIDLAGHTGHNVLLTMVRKPAPVQVTYIGFVATTGLTAIDYYLTDEVINPPGVDGLYSETLFRLPTYPGTYRAQSRNPLWRYQPRYAVRDTPALRNGYITFGSCNNLGKLTDRVLTLWGRLLEQMPTAHLLIEGKGFGKPEFAEEYRARCASLGIDTDRLRLVPLDTQLQYLAYHEIDIALDPFPLTGGTTTLDVLWMGVPLVSMEGNSSPSRMSTDALTYLGRTQWLARNESEYTEIAKGLAADVNQLNALRLSLRDEVEQSPLMRDDIAVPHVAAALRTMWLRWQAEREHPGDEAAQAKTVALWQAACPEHLRGPAVPRVGLKGGEKLTLHEAHSRLQQMVDHARVHCPPTPSNSAPGPMGPEWKTITETAEQVLSAVPNDPVALACLAEVEHAHGHADFALTYLRYATHAIELAHAAPAA